MRYSHPRELVGQIQAFDPSEQSGEAAALSRICPGPALPAPLRFPRLAQRQNLHGMIRHPRRTGDRQFCELAENRDAMLLLPPFDTDAACREWEGVEEFSIHDPIVH